MGFLALNRRRGVRARSGRKQDKISRNSFSTKLRFEHLEDRRLLATFLETGSTLMIALATNEQVGIVSHGTSYTFSLGDTGTWAGADSAKVTSQNGTPTLSVTPAGLAGFSGISIIDSGAGASVRFVDSGANTYSNNFSVILDKGGAESATVSGAADFGNMRVDLSAQQIAVDGRLTAKEVRLVGSETVTVTGAVQAPALTLTAGLLENSGELSSSGAVGGQLAIAADRFVNSGQITSDGSAGAGGTISIALAQRMMQTQSGLVSASGAGGSGGQVTIVAGDQATAASADSAPVHGVFLSGTIAAEGSGTGAAGGQITVTGGQLDLYGARLQADGEAGGGRIRVGGDFHGLGDMERAQCVTVNQASTLSADALARGNGGQVVVWSDQQTSFAGIARARGGARQGDGGKIEVSGRAALDWQGEAVVSAPAGQPGSLVLDPKNITIVGPTFTEFADPNPAAGNNFGVQVVPLSTGNVVITSPYDNFGAFSAGAVYLFNGATGALISALRGSHAYDEVGLGSVAGIGNGNYVVCSPYWHNGTVANAGAVTWGNGTTGIGGIISITNSLIGSHTSDKVGSQGVTALTNGNYVVCSPYWDNGTISDAGAVTWGSGTTGISGAVSSVNSLVGSHANDKVGYASSGNSVIPLGNGNYVIRSPSWDNGAATDAGAVTWGSGYGGVSGVLSSDNSLVGSTTNDNVGYYSNSVNVVSDSYVVISPYWDNGTIVDAGAVTWGNGYLGVSGVISSANSLLGSTAYDRIGNAGVKFLKYQDTYAYVVSSPNWDNGTATDAGAVTWGYGSIHGVISSSNSLVGSSSGDQIGYYGVKVLNSGNYVVCSPYWDNGAIANAGAVTWGSLWTGITGVVSSANSLVGSHAGDTIGYNTDNSSLGITALSNGNYVVSSPHWDNGSITDAGAVTWGSGTTGISGIISNGNSLVGSTANDEVGNGYVYRLANDNYVVCSYTWDNGAMADVGAATWGSGTAGVSGLISSSNSLIGSSAYDAVGIGGVTPLTNGNYVVISYYWKNGAAADAGAATWGNGTSGITGLVSSTNSLVGSHANDKVGYGYGATALPNGNYVVSSYLWDNDMIADAGAATWGNGATGISGVISSSNSLVGSHASDNVGRNIVTLANGNYVVCSLLWDNGSATDAGAVTWGSGATGVSGVISSANSLVGSHANDNVGFCDYGVVSVTALSNGNYVVCSSDWDNGVVTDAGAVTWGNGATGISGAVSSTNSLVGSHASDQVGMYSAGGVGVTAFANGNYVVNSYYWDNGAATDAGAVTWGKGTAGICGPITSANSLVGLTSNTSLQSAVVDDVNGTFYASFYNEGGGRVRVGSQNGPLASQTFASQTGQSVTLTPIVTGTLDTGAAVTLQASNDITIVSAITANNPGGNGGDLTLQAGRSLLINANITTDNGNLTLTANDTAANGVVDADRESGSAVITQAGGTTINVGSGTLTVNLRNSTDKTYNDRGAATFQDLTAGSIVLGDGAITANSISTGTLTIGAGVTLTIAPIVGGPQGARQLHNTLTKSLDAGAISPIASEITDQAAVTSTIEQSPSTAAAVAPGPVAASTVIGAPVLASSEAATMAATTDNLLSDSNKSYDQCRNALTPGPSTDQPTMPTNASRRCPMVPVGAQRGEVLLLIDTAINRLASQSSIYSWFDWTALPKTSDNRLENPLAGKQVSNANTAVFASLHDELPLRAGIIEKCIYTPATNGRQEHAAALQTNGFTRSVKSTSGEKTGAETDFEISRHARAVKHAGQLEKAIDTVIAEDDDLFLRVRSR